MGLSGSAIGIHPIGYVRPVRNPPPAPPPTLSHLEALVNAAARRYGLAQPPHDLHAASPAFHVDIQTIEIDVEKPVPHEASPQLPAMEGRALRPWPFRWPLPASEPVAPDAPPEPPRQLGNYIDIIV